MRVAQPSDAEGLVDLFHALDRETEFMLFEPGERQPSVEEQEQHLLDFAAADHKAMFVAETEGGEIVGFVVGIGGGTARTRHNAHCVVGLRQSCTGQGLGRRLLRQLEHWARSEGVKRLELTVMNHNIRAIKLYTAAGFVVEGVKRGSIHLRGRYIDELIMAKLLAAEGEVGC